MNKILLPLFLIISSIIFGQGNPFPNYQQFGSATTRTAFIGAPHGQKGIIIGRYADTLTANNNSLGNYIKFYPGAFIVTDNPRDELWQRNYNATAWISRGSVDITTINFITDSSVAFCFGNGVCDTISMNNFSTVVNNVIQNFNDSTVYHINDSTLVICNAAGSCDTINLGNSLTYNIFLDSTSNTFFLSTCDTVQTLCLGDSCYQQQTCDTIPLTVMPPITLYFNGVERLPNTNIVVFGQSNPAAYSNAQLFYDTYLKTTSYGLHITGAPTHTPVQDIEQNQWSQLNSSIFALRHNGAYQPTYNLLDENNPVRLYFNYTNPFTIPTQGGLAGDTLGFMGDRYGYMIMTNSRGSQTHYEIDDNNAKQVGIFFDTYTNNNEGVSIFAQQTPSAYPFHNNPPTDSTLLSKRIAIFKTEGTVQIPFYPSTRNDGPTSKALYTDIDGNVKLGPVNGGDIITIINDTTFIICSFGTNLCDTIYVTNINNVQTVEILNDSTLIVCDSVGVCDTLIVNTTVFSQPITADNGLIMSTPTNVQLGSPTPPGAPLLHNTYINAGGFNLTITGTVTPNTAGVLVVNNTNAGGTSAAAIRASTVSTSASSYGVFGSATSGIGMRGIATTGNGGSFTSTSGIALIGSSASSTGAQITSTSGLGAWVIINPSSTATETEILRLDRNSSGTPAVGMGGYMSFNMPTSANIIATEAARISAAWSNATSLSQTATLNFWTTNTATAEVKMQIAGSGSVRLHKYGVGTFTAGTATYLIATTSNGTLIEFPTGGLGGGTVVTAANNGVSLSSTTVQLGQAVAAPGNPAVLLDHREIPSANFTISFNADAAQTNNIIQTKNAAAAIHARVTSTAKFSNTGGFANSEQFGDNVSVTSVSATVVGNSSSGTAANSIAFGVSAASAGGIAIGNNISVPASAIGIGATVSQPGSLSVGFGSNAGDNNTIIGNNQAASYGDGAVGLGYQLGDIGLNSIGIGNQATPQHTYSIVIGGNAATTADKQVLIGANGVSVTGVESLYFGNGVTHNTLGDRLWTITGGSGTNAAGTSLTIAGSKGTGNAVTAPIIFQTAVPGSSGTTLQSLASRLTIGGDGSVRIHPITAAAASAITPLEGHLVFVSTTDATFTTVGIWCYQNGAWKAL